PAEDVADRPVGRLVHLVQAELLDARLVRRDRRALHADAVLLDRVGRVDGDLVAGLVALLDPEVEVLEVDVEVREDQPFADPLPDDPRHLVAVDLDDGVHDLDLRHAGRVLLEGSDGISAAPYGAGRACARRASGSNRLACMSQWIRGGSRAATPIPSLAASGVSASAQATRAVRTGRRARRVKARW